MLKVSDLEIDILAFETDVSQEPCRLSGSALTGRPHSWPQGKAGGTVCKVFVSLPCGSLIPDPESVPFHIKVSFRINTWHVWVCTFLHKCMLICTKFVISSSKCLASLFYCWFWERSHGSSGWPHCSPPTSAVGLLTWATIPNYFLGLWTMQKKCIVLPIMILFNSSSFCITLARDLRI